ncbi:MAG: hypothetical protein UHG68_07240, partial [Clostridia bacterium]|nr:hypothetical protein [Clostridia bacterium]
YKLFIVSGLKFNLYGDTYNEEFVKLDNYKTIPFWQDNSKDSAAVRAALHIITSANHAVKQGYILGILFDRDAAMVCNEEPEVRAQYNADGNFTNYIYAYDCSYYNDFDENALVYTWGNITLGTVTGVLAKGTNDGTTSMKATATAGGSLFYTITDEALNIAPGIIFDTTDTTVWTSLTSGTKKDNIPVTADQTINVIEVGTAGIVIASNQAVVTANYIK